MCFSFPQEPDDPFQVLGVPRNADEKTIKRAYRRLAKRCHPDRNPDQPEAEMRFRQVQQAYEALKTCREMAEGGSGARGGDVDEFRADPDTFGGFYWMLRRYLAKKKT